MFTTFASQSSNSLRDLARSFHDAPRADDDQLLLRLLPLSASESKPKWTAHPIVIPEVAAAEPSSPSKRVLHSSLDGVKVLGLLSALLYASVAVAMNFINKWTMEIFPLANFILILQMLATLAILQPLLGLKRLHFHAFSWLRARQLLLVCQLYTANTAFALYGLRTLNVPMYSTLKRLTPMAVLLTKATIQRRAPNPAITSAVSMVVLGTIVAGASDLAFNPTGYIFALLSCVSQAAYLILTEYQAAEGVSTTELLYYNAITSLPLLGGIMVATGEMARLPGVLHAACISHGTWQVALALACCSLMGCLLNYSLFLCTMTNSALTTTIVGVLKGVVAVVLGFFLLGGAPIHPVNIAGISLNTTGGIMYTVHKFRARGGKSRHDARVLLASPSQDAMTFDTLPRIGGSSPGGGSGSLQGDWGGGAPWTMHHRNTHHGQQQLYKDVESPLLPKRQDF